MPRLKNIRQEKFSREYVTNSGNGTQAYLSAYPGVQNNSANVNSSQLLTKTNVKERITELLENQTGARLSVLLEDLINLKDATKPLVVDKIVQYTKDNGVSLEATKTLLKLHGLLQPNSNQVDARSVTFNVNPPDLKSLDTILNRLESIDKRDDRISGKM